jgi:uncharacterized protein YndB with AHSA1/START domain
MKILKRIALVIVSIAGLLLIIALFVKKDYTVEREIGINKPRQEVFDYVKHLKNQENYNKWVMKDPKARKEYKGTDGTVGFASSWDSDDSEVGKGEQEITNIKEGERIDLGLHFIKPFKNNAIAYMTTETTAANETKLKWGMSGSTPYPMNLMNLFIPNILGKDMETSLSRLKATLEK